METMLKKNNGWSVKYDVSKLEKTVLTWPCSSTNYTLQIPRQWSACQTKSVGVATVRIKHTSGHPTPFNPRYKKRRTGTKVTEYTRHETSFAPPSTMLA